MFQNTIESWGIIFIIAALAYILPSLFFVLFGSGEVQSWNEVTLARIDQESKNDDVVDSQP